MSGGWEELWSHEAAGWLWDASWALLQTARPILSFNEMPEVLCVLT